MVWARCTRAEVEAVVPAAREAREHCDHARYGRQVCEVRGRQHGRRQAEGEAAVASKEEEDVEEGQGQPTQVVPSQGQEEDEVTQPRS